MSKKVLTPAAAMEAKRLYALRDARGRQLHSQMEIADLLGVSETTVFRAVHKRAAYAGVRELPTGTDAEKSLAEFRRLHPEYFEGQATEKMQAEILRAVEAPGKVVGLLEELRSPPKSALDE